MKARKSFTIAVIVVVIVHYSGAEQLVRMCYFRAESRKRTTVAQFGVEQVDFSLCTHYIYAYGQIDATTKVIQAMEPVEEEGAKGHYNRFNHAKLRYRTMKTLLSVGGPSQQAHQAFASMDASDMLVFAKSVVIFLRNRGFDGLDIDWPLPERYTDRDKLPRILQALRREFDDNTDTRLLLTVAASGLQTDIDRGFDAQVLQSYVDYTLIKSHSLYLPDMDYAHFSSPLFQPPSLKTFPFNTLSMNYSIHYWNAVGMPFKKMVVGISGAGRYLEFQSVLYTSPLSAVTKTILTGPYYNLPSGLAYPEVCFTMDSAKLFYDDVQKCPYLVKQGTWIGYENTASIKEKLAWMKTVGVAGVMFAAMDEDDFTGSDYNVFSDLTTDLNDKQTVDLSVMENICTSKMLFCENGTFPLLKYIKSQIPDDAASSTKSVATTTTTHLPPEDTGPSLNDTLMITIICFFLYGLAIGCAYLILSKRDTENQ